MSAQAVSSIRWTAARWWLLPCAKQARPMETSDGMITAGCCTQQRTRTQPRTSAGTHTSDTSRLYKTESEPIATPSEGRARVVVTTSLPSSLASGITQRLQAVGLAQRSSGPVATVLCRSLMGVFEPPQPKPAGPGLSALSGQHERDWKQLRQRTQVKRTQILGDEEARKAALTKAYGAARELLAASIQTGSAKKGSGPSSAREQSSSSRRPQSAPTNTSSSPRIGRQHGRDGALSSKELLTAPIAAWGSDVAPSSAEASPAASKSSSPRPVRFVGLSQVQPPGVSPVEDKASTGKGSASAADAATASARKPLAVLNRQAAAVTSACQGGQGGEGDRAVSGGSGSGSGVSGGGGGTHGAVCRPYSAPVRPPPPPTYRYVDCIPSRAAPSAPAGSAFHHSAKYMQDRVKRNLAKQLKRVMDLFRMMHAGIDFLKLSHYRPSAPTSHTSQPSTRSPPCTARSTHQETMLSSSALLCSLPDARSPFAVRFTHQAHSTPTEMAW